MKRSRFGRRRGSVGLLLVLSLSAQPSLAQKAKQGGKRPAPEAAAVAAAPSGPKSLSDTLTGEAKAALEAGKLLYGDGDFAGAGVKFLAAYASSKDPRLLWNMAVCEKGLRHYARVLELGQRYLELGGELLSEADRVEATELLAAIDAFTVSLTLTVNEPGASVSIDGAPVGSTPLEKPVVVDIGTREIAVTKPGFKPFRSSVPVGGQKQASLKVTLEPEMHRGELTVKAPRAASITIDGKTVGHGRWTGQLSSGGHTLRVEAQGMRPYQSEVVIQDDEKRGVDVVLEPVAVAAKPPEKHGPLYDLESGFRTGYGLASTSTERCGDSAGGGSGGCTGYDTRDVRFIPLGLDIGYRLGRPTYIGMYAQYGWLDKSETCGIARHGAEPDDAADSNTRYGYTSCRMFKLGSGVVFHLLPRTIIDPYFGFDMGIQGTLAKYRSYDPVTGDTSDGADNRIYFQPGFQLGIDVHPVRTVGVGLFTQMGPNFGGNNGNDNPQNNSGSDCTQPGAVNCQPRNDCSKGTCTTSDKSDQAYILFGSRVAYTFP